MDFSRSASLDDPKKHQKHEFSPTTRMTGHSKSFSNDVLQNMHPTHSTFNESNEDDDNSNSSEETLLLRAKSHPKTANSPNVHSFDNTLPANKSFPPLRYRHSTNSIRHKTKSSPNKERITRLQNALTQAADKHEDYQRKSEMKMMEMKRSKMETDLKCQNMKREIQKLKQTLSAYRYNQTMHTPFPHSNSMQSVHQMQHSVSSPPSTHYAAISPMVINSMHPNFSFPETPHMHNNNRQKIYHSRGNTSYLYKSPSVSAPTTKGQQLTPKAMHMHNKQMSHNQKQFVSVMVDAYSEGDDVTTDDVNVRVNVDVVGNNKSNEEMTMNQKLKKHMNMNESLTAFDSDVLFGALNMKPEGTSDDDEIDTNSTNLDKNQKFTPKQTELDNAETERVDACYEKMYEDQLKRQKKRNQESSFWDILLKCVTPSLCESPEHNSYNYNKSKLN